MFWIGMFIAWWAIWLLLADKAKWRAILPVSVFSSWISFIVEAFMYHGYKLWDYSGQHLEALLVNGLGTYMVVTYLFIQWYPQDASVKKRVLYYFYWTSFALSLEWGHWMLGHIHHYRWWNLGWSYISDWFLFWLFFKFYDSLHLKRLSERQPLSPSNGSH